GSAGQQQRYRGGQPPAGFGATPEKAISECHAKAGVELGARRNGTTLAPFYDQRSETLISEQPGLDLRRRPREEPCSKNDEDRCRHDRQEGTHNAKSEHEKAEAKIDDPLARRDWGRSGVDPVFFRVVLHGVPSSGLNAYSRNSTLSCRVIAVKETSSHPLSGLWITFKVRQELPKHSQKLQCCPQNASFSQLCR